MEDEYEVPYGLSIGTNFVRWPFNDLERPRERRKQYESGAYGQRGSASL